MLKINEHYTAIQGEGRTAGKPCVFLRLAECNLSCAWCDTKFTWHPRYMEKPKEYLPVELVKELLTFYKDYDRLVITGGEPMLQQEDLNLFFSELGLRVFPYIEIETNGTIMPISRFGWRVHQYNCSPKLSNSGIPREQRIDEKILKTFVQTGKSHFKFVVNREEDVHEIIRDFVHIIPREMIWLMPLGHTRDLQLRYTPTVMIWALRYGMNFSPRLQVLAFNTERKV